MERPSLSMASSLVISFLVAWLAIPVLASRFLRGQQAEKIAHERVPEHRIYPAIMRPVLAAPWLVEQLSAPRPWRRRWYVGWTAAAIMFGAVAVVTTHAMDLLRPLLSRLAGPPTAGMT